MEQDTAIKMNEGNLHDRDGEVLTGKDSQEQL